MVKKKNYIPDRGDLVWLNFNPQSGHEQSGKRPALTISFEAYNTTVGLALFCPITSKIKGYPFEVVISGKKINGCVLSDQIKSLDWKVRKVEYIEKIEADKLEEVIENIKIMIEK